METTGRDRGPGFRLHLNPGYSIPFVEGTPLEFPVPYQEMQTRQKPFYLLGPGFGSAAAKGAYGF